MTSRPWRLFKQYCYEDHVSSSFNIALPSAVNISNFYAKVATFIQTNK